MIQAEEKLSKRAKEMLARIRRGDWYNADTSDSQGYLRPRPQALQELLDSKLVHITGRAAVLKTAVVPLGFTNDLTEGLPIYVRETD